MQKHPIMCTYIGRYIYGQCYWRRDRSMVRLIIIVHTSRHDTNKNMADGKESRKFIKSVEANGMPRPGHQFS